VPKDIKELTTFTFLGPSFEDHGLELDVLSELIQYKKIILETAEALWRRKNLDRERLPKGFRESLQIKFFELRQGSTVVPLFREISVQGPQTYFDFHLDDELDQAVELLEAGIQAAAEDKPLPEYFPKSVLPSFENLGKTLKEFDCIRVKSQKRDHPATFTTQVRERLAEYGERTYEDFIDFTGEVRLADLDGLNFVIRLENGTKVSGKFEPEHEQKLIEALKEHETCRLKIKGLGKFSLPDGTLKKVVRINEMEVQPLNSTDYAITAKPFWKLIEEVRNSVPEKEWIKVPEDLSKELDHYLYGRKRSES